MVSSSTAEDDSGSSHNHTKKIRKSVTDSLAKLKEEEERIDFLIKRLVNAENEKAKSRLENENLKQERVRNNLLEKKLDSVEKMLSKTELSKSKLEQLCRELNKSNKEEKERSQQRLKLMQKTHQETVDTFKKSLVDIQLSVQAKQEQSKQVADVEKLSNNLNQLAGEYDQKLQNLKQLYEGREEDIQLMAKAKEEEVALLKSELDDMRKRIREVFEENLKVKKDLLASEERVKTTLESEIGLRKMLDSYSQKYSKMLKSLENSNESFDRIKKEMAKMNANLIRVEADARKWKGKVEESNKLIGLMNKKTEEREQALALKDRQLFQLQELCRRLQKKEKDEAFSQEEISPSSPEKEAINLEVKQES